MTPKTKIPTHWDVLVHVASWEFYSCFDPVERKTFFVQANNAP